MSIPNEERKCLVQPKFSINSDEDVDSYEFEDIFGKDIPTDDQMKFLITYNNKCHNIIQSKVK